VRDTARRVFGAIESSKTTGEFATNVTKLCEWCDFQAWCPAHGGEIARAKDEATVKVQLRRRQVGLAAAS
jgi:putative RecB family exonuclease